MWLDDEYRDVGNTSVPLPDWEGNTIGEYGGMVENKNVLQILKYMRRKPKCGCE